MTKFFFSLDAFVCQNAFSIRELLPQPSLLRVYGKPIATLERLGRPPARTDELVRSGYKPLSNETNGMLRERPL